MNTELQNPVEEISKLKEEVGNLMTLNKELLEGKKDTHKKEVEEAQAKTKKLQLDFITLDNEFQTLNTLRADISSHCTWERKVKEKLQGETKELK